MTLPMMSTRTPHTNAPAQRPALKELKRFPDSASGEARVISLWTYGSGTGWRERTTSEAKFLLHRGLHEPKCLRIQQVEKVAEATKKEDVPLVLAHAMRIEFAIHEQRLLLIQWKTIQLWIVEDGMAAVGDVFR